MSTEVTLKRIGFKAGTAAAPDPVAEIVLMCSDPSQVVHLTRYVSKTVLVDVAPVQQELPLEGAIAAASEMNGHHAEPVAIPSAGRRRRGSQADPTEGE